MSDDNKNFSIEDIMKKIENGDNSLLVIAGMLLIIPVITLLILTSNPKGTKRMSQEKMKSLVHRKNVFNFGTKTEEGKRKAPKSSSSSSLSNWFQASTPEERAKEELRSADKIMEKKAAEIHVPSHLEGDARKQYMAENNYNLCMANGALESCKYKEAEEYLAKALDEAKDNNFLLLYALGTLCALYERTGDRAKLEQAYKMYIEAVSKIPPEYGGMDLKKSVRDAYQGLLVLGRHASESEISDAMAKEPLVKSGQLPTGINIREVYKNFPIKYE